MNHLIVIALVALVVVIFVAQHRLRPWTLLIGGAIALLTGVVGIVGGQMDQRLIWELKLNFPPMWEDGFIQLSVVALVLAGTMLGILMCTRAGMDDFEPHRV